MNPQFQAVLAEYERRAAQEADLMRSLPIEEGMRRRDEFLISVGPSTGALLNLLAREHKVRHVLEIGTSYGYSTLWLADAVRQSGGKVTTLELHEGKAAYAKEMMTKAALADQVEFLVGDALASIEAVDAKFDFVLIDIWKELYIPCLDRVLPKLAPGALVVADNMLEPAFNRPEAEAYRSHVSRSGRFDSVLLAVGSGIEISRLR
jgi:predicted O-methyltransferase YrrM